MKRLSRTQRYILIGGAGLIVLILLYRFYKGSSGEAAPAEDGIVPDNAIGALGAQLAGQQQADMAAMSNQHNADIEALTGLVNEGLAGVIATESANTQTLTGAIADLSTNVGDLTGYYEGLSGAVREIDMDNDMLGERIADLATGVEAVERSQQGRFITPRAGGPFARYYRRITGKTPPARIRADNFIYQAWRQGIKASALRPARGTSNAAVRKNTHETRPHTKGKPATRARRPANNKSRSHGTSTHHAQRPRQHPRAHAPQARPAPQHREPQRQQPARHQPAPQRHQPPPPPKRRQGRRRRRR